MNIVRETPVDNNGRIFHLQDFFPLDLRQSIDQYLATAQWSDAEAWLYRRARFHCHAKGDLAPILLDFANSADIAGRFSSLIGQDLVCDAMEFWKDLPRFLMGPHLDAMPETPWWACQIYLGSNNHPLGTVFYSKSLATAAHLPYHDNTGYFADRTDRILHGVCKVPMKTFRYSIYLKYRLRDQR